MEDIMNHSDEVPEIKANLKIMERNTNRLLDISNQLLDFRKIEAKGFSLNFEYVNIAELVRDIHTNFQLLAAQHNLDYSLHSFMSEFYTYADPDSVQKILSNLYSNAIKYAETVVEARFIFFKKENKLQFQIRNDGFLIPVEAKEKIFEPFFRIGETSLKKGTGIGLAIARSLTELHKGTLELREPEDGMNLFVLELPIHSPKETIARQQSMDVPEAIN